MNIFNGEVVSKHEMVNTSNIFNLIKYRIFYSGKVLWHYCGTIVKLVLKGFMWKLRKGIGELEALKSLRQKHDLKYGAKKKIISFFW